MKVFFVMDIRDGTVVAGKSGERERYAPINESSSIVSSSDPIEVISVIKPRYLYVADLDRIMGKGDNMAVLDSINRMVDELIADCGFKRPSELEELSFVPVLGTETYDITELVDNCYVSLDFREKFLDASGRFDSWKDAVEYLNSFTLRGVIVLSIHAVGTMRVDLDLLESVMNISDNPVLLGGGVSGIEDLEKLKDMGCSGVLVATAVHRKRIPIDVVRRGEI